MYANLLENRNKSVSELIKLGKCIGRSLRENVKLFSVDSENNMVSYLTESDYIIEGNYDTEDGLTLSDIVITSTENIKDDALYEDHVNQQIGSFVGDLLGDNRGDASVSFDKILNLWENKVRLINEEDKIKKEADRNRSNTSIVGTSEFSKLVEVSPNLVEFLSENKQDIVENTNILEYLAFSNVISKAFDTPRLTLEMLAETSKYTLKDTITSPVFDVICKQELLKQELYGSKREFDTMWVNNSHIQKLLGNIFEQDREEVYGTLIETVTEIPYFALATKKQLVKLFTNSVSMNEGVAISENDIKQYVSEIYEINKPIKEGIVGALSEKYGINIKKLNDIPSFRMIIENQLVLFEELCSIMDENTNLYDVLQETVRMLKNKNGVEGIDINDYTQYIFEEADYTDVLTEKQLTKHIKVDFKKIAKDVGNLADTFSTLKDKVGQQYDSNEGQGAESSEKAETKSPSDGKAKEAKKAEKEPETPAAEVPEEQPEGADPAAEDEVETAEPPKNKKEMNKDLQAMEDLISDLAAEFGAEDPTGAPDNGTDDEGSTNK